MASRGHNGAGRPSYRAPSRASGATATAPEANPVLTPFKDWVACGLHAEMHSDKAIADALMRMDRNMRRHGFPGIRISPLQITRHQPFGHGLRGGDGGDLASPSSPGESEIAISIEAIVPGSQRCSSASRQSSVGLSDASGRSDT